MKRFLIWGIKWTCLSLCGFALCGNMAYVAVSANSLAYDEDSSSDESYTNSNDYTENSFAESDTSVKNFAESNDNDDESYSEPNDYEQPDEIQEAQDNEPETGLKAIQGFGKKSEENIAEKISNPYGVYYTTPKCEDQYLMSARPLEGNILQNLFPIRISKIQMTDLQLFYVPVTNF